MSARLTPLRRFAPRLHTAPAACDEASAVDVPIPLPPATVTTPWPPRRGGASFALPAHAEPVHVPQPADEDALAAARRESWEAGLADGIAEGKAQGMRLGAERRSWWDIIVGLTLGATLATALILGGIGAGMAVGGPAASKPVHSPAPATTLPQAEPGRTA